MFKGYYEKRIDSMSENIYIVDGDRMKYLKCTITEHEWEEGKCGNEFLRLRVNEDKTILSALAEALQAGGYIPKSAVDAELKATKYHLEDMRLLAQVTVKIKKTDYL